MKALTLKASWAWCVFNAGKDIENRSYNTNYRGPLVIHCAKSLTMRELTKVHEGAVVMRSLPPISQLYLGQVIGVTDLVDCYYSPEAYGEWGFADSYHWVIKNPRPIRRFYHKGQLGLFNIPDNLIDFDASKNPILEECGYKSKGNPRGEWRVTVWLHPSRINKYSYAQAIAGGVACGGEGACPEDPTLFGCYDTPEIALAEGIKSVYE